jgi:hypothetical protein
MQPKSHLSKETLDTESQRMAEAVRAACIDAALAGYEDASMRGLCREGAWECAISAIRMLNVQMLLSEQTTNNHE